MIGVEVICRLNANDSDVVAAGRDFRLCESTVRSCPRAVVADCVPFALEPNLHASERFTLKAEYATLYCASREGAADKRENRDQKGQ
jgi:hypothetical protein